MRKVLEINGNLNELSSGIDNYDLFQKGIVAVLDLFNRTFNEDLLNKIPIYVDNATKDSGYTPIITPVFNKLLIVKLNVDSESDFAKIIYQFSHELTHAIFYNYYGLSKPKATDNEESICSAVSLITVKTLSPNDFPRYLKHVESLKNGCYSNGINIAKNCSFNLKEIETLILDFNEYK